MHHDRPLSEAERDEFRELVRRRGEREPLAYVLGEWDFRGLTLKVDRRALVPRPETEVVVERCLALLDGRPEPRVLDVGVGTGAIALAIAQEHPGAQVKACDLSAEALDLARENAESIGIPIALEQRDLREGLGTGQYDLVVSNPPYVLPEEIETLEPEVRDWEPRVAIVGMEHTHLVAEHAAEVLPPGGRLVLEVAGERGADVVDLLERLGYDDVRLTLDLAGSDRVVEGVRR
jgi:release factor glutamine methyltransferase